MFQKVFLVIALIVACIQLQTTAAIADNFAPTDLNALKGELSKTLSIEEAVKTADVYARMMAENMEDVKQVRIFTVPLICNSDSNLLM